MKFFVAMIFLANLLWAMVDINSADKAQLIKLKGIGAKKADAILLYRKTHCFKNIEDLTSVKGIGKKIVEKNKKNLEASRCKI